MRVSIIAIAVLGLSVLALAGCGSNVGAATPTLAQQYGLAADSFNGANAPYKADITAATQAAPVDMKRITSDFSSVADNDNRLAGDILALQFPAPQHDDWARLINATVALASADRAYSATVVTVQDGLSILPRLDGAQWDFFNAANAVRHDLGLPPVPPEWLLGPRSA